MSVTIGVRTLVSFTAGVAVAVIALVVFQAVRADAAPGDVDATFVPITACRLVDTRPAPDRVGTLGAFGADVTETLAARGSNGQCSLPSDAVGLTLNVTAVNASAPTFLTVWGDGARPKASSLNPAPGQPPTPNAVTVDLAGDGSFKIYNLAGTVQVIVDVTGYYTNTSLTDLHERLEALETAGVDVSVLARLEALETKTASMSSLTDPTTGQPTVRFSDVNVQIVDGSGDTDGGVNGRGNLIVGYNEIDEDPKVVATNGTKIGSHNLITGSHNTYLSYGGLTAGRGNAISAPYASVSGGENNAARGRYASVSGGQDSSSLFNWSSVSGGFNNVASGLHASVSGGQQNLARGVYSSVSGGHANVADGESSSVSGGSANTADGIQSSVLGGVRNEVTGNNDTIIGGDNLVCADSSEGACGEYENTAAEWRPSDG